MALFENSNQLKPSFLTVAWMFFSLIAVLTAITEYDAGQVGILSWIICLGGIVIAFLLNIL